MASRSPAAPTPLLLLLLLLLFIPAFVVDLGAGIAALPNTHLPSAERPGAEPGAWPRGQPEHGVAAADAGGCPACT